MNQNKLSFQSFDLKIDEIAFNINTQDFEKIQMIANYFAEHFKCQTRFIDKKEKTKKKLLYLRKPYCVADFYIGEIDYWKGTILRFSGRNAAIFYDRYKSLNPQHFNPSIFNMNFISLGRLDLKYDRMITHADPSLINFLQETKLKLLSNKVKVQLKGQSLKVWTRKNSPKHYRTYLRENGKEVRFELELKRKKAKAYQHSFFRQDFDEFEKSYTYTYFKETSQIFDIDNLYLDWFKREFRSVRQSQFLIHQSLSTTYLTLQPIYQDGRTVDFYRFLQLLKFIENLQSQRASVAYGKATYRSYQFPLHDFLEFTGYQKTNYYQLEQLKDFIISLDKIPTFSTYFSDEHYRGVTFFSFVDVQKQKNTWYVILVGCEELIDLFYPFPFHLPQVFFTYRSKYSLWAQVFVLQVLAQRKLQKRLNTQAFFSELSLGDSAYLEVKKNLVVVFNQLSDSKIIQSDFTVTNKNGKVITVSNLTSNIISRSKWIDFYENIGL